MFLLLKKKLMNFCANEENDRSFFGVYLLKIYELSCVKILVFLVCE